MKRTWIVALAVLVIAVVAYAQMPGEPGRPQPGPVPRMVTAQPVMVADDDHIFILRGSELLKVKESDLTVVKVVTLPMPKPPAN